MALDRLKIPYDYISVQTVAATPALRARWDVVVFPPVGRPAAATVAGMPRWGNALPWKTTALTPNLGKIDSTDDMRPGLGAAGVQNLREFVAAGGLLIGVMDTAELAVNYGLTHGVALGRAEKLKAPGTIVRAKVVDAASPITYGYPDSFSIYTADGPIFSLTNLAGGRSRRRPRRDGASDRARHRRRSRSPQGRAFAAPPDEPKAEAWEALPLTEEQRRNPIYVIPPASGRAPSSVTATRKSCSSPACSKGRATSRSTRRWWTSRWRRGTSCSSRTTRSGAGRPWAATSSSSTPSELRPARRRPHAGRGVRPMETRVCRRIVGTLALAGLPGLVLGQSNDEAYGKKIREYTTDPMFLTELVDHLPASARVPSPEKFLGYVVGHAEPADLREGRAPLLPRAGQGLAPRPRLFDGHDGGGPRADPGGALRRGEPRPGSTA
jgi:hypothetical protein